MGEFNKKLHNIEVEFQFILVPHQRVYFASKYPYNLNDSTQEGSFYYINKLKENHVNAYYTYDEFERFSNDLGQYLYYKVDHHWNHEGFFLGYNLILEQLDQLSIDKNDNDISWEKYCNKSKPFIGSLSRQVMNSYRGYEVFCNYLPIEGYSEYSFTFNGKLSKPNYDNIYNNYPAEYWHVFNSDQEIIYDFNQPQYDNLMIIKDSYSNPIGIMLAQHFNKTFMYDPRHIDESIDDYIVKNDIDVVVWITHDLNFSNVYYQKLIEFNNNKIISN